MSPRPGRPDFPPARTAVILTPGRGWTHPRPFLCANPQAGPAMHIPVLPDEVHAVLDPQSGQLIVDATIGSGGHAALLWPRLQPGGRLVGIDQDPTMLQRAAENLGGAPVVLVHRNF